MQRGRGQWDLPGQVVELGDGGYLAYLRAAQMRAYGAMVQCIVLQAFPLGYAVRVHLLLFSRRPTTRLSFTIRTAKPVPAGRVEVLETVASLHPCHNTQVRAQGLYGLEFQRQPIG